MITNGLLASALTLSRPLMSQRSQCVPGAPAGAAISKRYVPLANQLAEVEVARPGRIAGGERAGGVDGHGGEEARAAGDAAVEDASGAAGHRAVVDELAGDEVLGDRPAG